MLGDFLQNFGIPSFPFEGVDPQGGLLAPNVPGDPGAAGQMPGSQPPAAQTPPQAMLTGNPGGQPAAGQPPAPAGPSPLGSPLTLGNASPASGVASTLGAPSGNPAQSSDAPAAGVGSPFQRTLGA